MDDLKQQMRNYFLQYASYVILDRAIPSIVDGLKPVQRRILHTLYGMHDGKLHKVANVAGQTMALHPHGDAPIIDALVNLANKNLLMDRQGNFGNLYTGDPAAAARYIETRLSKLGIDTLFNPEITPTTASYDGRNQEPIYLPAKIPLLLILGAEGIAVGMSTKILPHNFKELLEAQISLLQDKTPKILPDFPTGGIMDASEYNSGRGRVKVRVKCEIPDDKTIIIRQICPGTTTESLIESIDEAAKKGKIKIDSINDYTAENVEIEIKLPRGHYAKQLLDSLYAFTQCEVSIQPQMVVIQEGHPVTTTVLEILKHNTAQLKGFLQQELELDRHKIKERIFSKNLEQIFIENRLYKKLEEVKSEDLLDKTVETSLKPFIKILYREPVAEDRRRLLAIPIRRISKFDIDKNQEEIAACEKELEIVEKKLKNMVKTAIDYLQALLEKYGAQFPRKTAIKSIEEVDVRAVSTRKVKLFVDPSGFIGTKVDGEIQIECTNYDKILAFSKDGTYTVTPIRDKHFVSKEEIVHVGIADKQTVFTVLFLDEKKQICVKRFVVSQFIQDKIYRFVDEKGKFLALTTAENPAVELFYKEKPKQKVNQETKKLGEELVKNPQAKGVRISDKELKRFNFNCPVNLRCIPE